MVSSVRNEILMKEHEKQILDERVLFFLLVNKLYIISRLSLIF